MRKFLFLSILLLLLGDYVTFAQSGKGVTLEKIAEKCKDSPIDQRITIKVEKFSIKTNKCPNEFGGELKAMLTNAVQKINCFNVLESDSESGGFSNQGGDNIDAQLIVTGEVTQFMEKKIRVFGLENNNVTVGFILKVLNSQTGAILFSESVNGEATAQGYSSKLFSTSNLTGAVAQAVEIAIIKAVEVLADKKDRIEAPIVKAKVFDPSSCVMLKNGKGPKIMILIPEAQTVGGPVAAQQSQQSLEQARLEAEKEQYKAIGSFFKSISRNNQKEQPQQQTTNANAVKKSIVIEQAIAENIIIKKFIEAGFRVIDPKVYDKLRKQVDTVSDDVSKMAALGLKMGANIIITGYAVSERVPNQDGRFSFRGSIELRALTTDDATILASQTVQAGGNDAAESIASNKSLRNASFKMADYMLDQLCKRNMTFADNSPTASKVGGSASSANQTVIIISNTNFTQIQSIVTHLKSNSKVKEIKKTLTGKSGRLEIDHTLSTDQIAELLSNCKTVTLEITGLEGEKIEATVK